MNVKMLAKPVCSHFGDFLHLRSGGFIWGSSKQRGERLEAAGTVGPRAILDNLRGAVPGATQLHSIFSAP